jgi:hypothetical protein
VRLYICYDEQATAAACNARREYKSEQELHVNHSPLLVVAIAFMKRSSACLDELDATTVADPTAPAPAPAPAPTLTTSDSASAVRLTKSQRRRRNYQARIAAATPAERELRQHARSLRHPKRPRLGSDTQRDTQRDTQQVQRWHQRSMHEQRGKPAFGELAQRYASLSRLYVCCCRDCGSTNRGLL